MSLLLSQCETPSGTLLLTTYSRIFMSMIIRAYAKINLGLRILRRREDGFHDIETIFHRINLADEIDLKLAETITLTCTGGEITADESNFCFRTARLLQSQGNTGSGAAIRLTKRIPVGAGLGGGSSDAASTLLGLNKLWDLRLTPDELLPIAARLGSDVPYFLRPGSAFATGRGELLEYFPLDIPFSIVVAYPGIHVSTAWAYSNIRINEKKEQTSLKSIILSSLHQPETMQDVIHNDFEQLVFSHYPAVAETNRILRGYGAFFTRLSGSGSALFGFFRDERGARHAIRSLENKCTVSFTPSHFVPPVL